MRPRLGVMMIPEEPEDTPAWSEEDSAAFVEYGHIFVPGRETQIEIMGALVGRAGGHNVWELCCGAGALAEALLARHPACMVTGFDGSALMRQQAAERLTRFGERFRAVEFDLAERAWRHSDRPVHAVVSSLAIHHLEDAQKLALFRDLLDVLAPGGRLVIADVVEPAGAAAADLAAAAWDDAVRRRSLDLTGDTAAYDFFREQQWNLFRHPDPMDRPASLYAQLSWLVQAGFTEVDVYWLHAGHALFGGRKPEARE